MLRNLRGVSREKRAPRQKPKIAPRMREGALYHWFGFCQRAEKWPDDHLFPMPPNRMAPRHSPQGALPHTHMHRHTVSPDDLKKRAPALAAWLNGVLEDEGAMASMACRHGR